MKLEDWLNQNPVVILAIVLMLGAWSFVQLIPLIKKVFDAALANRRRSKLDEPEPKNETLEALKAMTITLQLFIETTSQRDARIAHLADTVAESTKNVTKQTEVLGELAKSITQLALTANNQTTQLAQQTNKLSELTGRLGYANQLGEDTKNDISQAVNAVNENKQSIEAQTQRINELKDQVINLENLMREDAMPMLHDILKALDGLATKSDLAQMGEFTNKLNLIEAEVKALIVTMAISKPSEPQDSPAPPPASAVVDSTKPLEKAETPKEDKPSEPSTNN